MKTGQTETAQESLQSPAIDLEKEVLTKLDGSGLSVFYLCGWLRKERGVEFPLELLKDLVQRGLIVYGYNDGILILKKK